MGEDIRKQYIIFGVILCLMTAPAETDYMAEMHSAALIGAHEWGASAEQARNTKIDSLNSDVPKVSYNDLFLLAKIMELEAGGCEHDECALGVGEVVLNRVAHHAFPGTIDAVLRQARQYYYPSMATVFERSLPSARCLWLAQRLLEGERHMAPNVVYHDNWAGHGDGVYAAYKHSGHGTLYFMYEVD